MVLNYEKICHCIWININGDDVLFFNSTNLFADQVYAEKKVITQQVVPGINTSVEVTIVECIGVGATPCTASTTTKTSTNKDTNPNP